MMNQRFSAASGGFFKTSRLSRGRLHEKGPFGFTLVELIVVITILAILATIGFLSLQGYTSDARDTVVKTNVKSIATAVSSESASSGNSPRYYVVHSSWAALSWASAVFDGTNPSALTGGAWNQSGTNYSAGNPDYTKLKLNANKFAVPDSGNSPDLGFPASYDPKYLTVGAADGSAASPNGRRRSVSFFQTAGISLPSGAVSVSGNYQAATGGASGLVKDPGSTGALMDGTTSAAPSYSSSGGGPSKYPGCDTNDIPLANGQVWAACNVGASNAWTGGVALTDCGNTATDCALSKRNTLGSYFQWGRNDDVTAQGVPTAVLAATGTLAGGVGHSNFITNGNDWMSAQNSNLWGGGATTYTSGTFTGASVGDQSSMTGPCASGYHVPTVKEWCDAAHSINGSVSCIFSMMTFTDSSVATTLKLPVAGLRTSSTGGYSEQGAGGSYWTSSPSGTTGYFVWLSSSSIAPLNNRFRAYALPVRCAKN